MTVARYPAEDDDRARSRANAERVRVLPQAVLPGVGAGRGSRTARIRWTGVFSTGGWTVRPGICPTPILRTMRSFTRGRLCCRTKGWAR